MSLQSNSNCSKKNNKRNLSSSSLSPNTEENKAKFFCSPNQYSALAQHENVDNDSSLIFQKWSKPQKY
ncbi:Nucleic-acid-binding protein [Aphis craccivora]|uniref:Nucleic-acid-binding protein n=1 Tax=Aphis craccivora TaxID=307492 RepID=A0A6G0Z9K7_APHCR|nr:Nucleic-acid-binding protein [Aphis craccivora]